MAADFEIRTGTAGTCCTWGEPSARWRLASTGGTQELGDYWSKGEPLWNLDLIKVPTMPILVESSADTPSCMAQTPLPLLKNAGPKEVARHSEDTLSIMSGINRRSLSNKATRFLGDARLMASDAATTPSQAGNS